MDSKFSTLFSKNMPLSTENRRELVAALSDLLIFDPVFVGSTKPSQIADILQLYGPFWVTIDADPEMTRRSHAVVVSDITEGNDPNTSVIRYYDVATGEISESSFSEFIEFVRTGVVLKEQLAYSAIRLLNPVGESGVPDDIYEIQVRNLFNPDGALAPKVTITKPDKTTIVRSPNSFGRYQFKKKLLEQEGTYLFEISYDQSKPYSTQQVFDCNKETFGSKPVIETPQPMFFQIKDKKLGLVVENDPLGEMIGDILVYKFRPMWMGNSKNHAKRQGKIKYVVIHLAANFISAYQQFYYSKVKVSSTNYMIDTDGKALKIIQEELESFHGDPCNWDGLTHINDVSIGIDLVEKTSGGYEDAQYDTLIELLQMICEKYDIDPVNVIAHSDIESSPDRSDPGRYFEWKRLAEKGFSFLPMRPASTIDVLYGGVFSKYSDLLLTVGDTDAAKKYGGESRTDFTDNNVIRQIQDDLASLGYMLETNGVYGPETYNVVRAFKLHVLSKGWFDPDHLGESFYNGTIDRKTAEQIRIFAKT